MKKKKSKFNIVLLVILLIMAQYVSAHFSRWLNTAGSFDLTYMGDIGKAFTDYPYDFFSFNIGCYAFTYLIFIFVFLNIIFKSNPPKAQMKGEEHGSNDFMTSLEIAEFTKAKSTPNFEYSTDCTKAATKFIGGKK